MSDWIKNEFKNLSLGDKRLDKRFLMAMSSFQTNPQGCINQVLKDEKAARKATYRLFDNQNLAPRKF